MTDWRSHKKQAEAEDVEFLRRNGLSDEQIAKRLGIQVGSLKRRDDRAEDKEDE